MDQKFSLRYSVVRVKIIRDICNSYVTRMCVSSREDIEPRKQSVISGLPVNRPKLPKSAVFAECVGDLASIARSMKANS